MSQPLLDQGKAQLPAWHHAGVKAGLAWVGITSDGIAPASTQSQLNPTAGSAVLIAAASATEVDANRLDIAASLSGAAFPHPMRAAGLLYGPAAAQCASRSLLPEAQIEASDVVTITVRLVRLRAAR